MQCRCGGKAKSKKTLKEKLWWQNHDLLLNHFLFFILTITAHCLLPIFPASLLQLFCFFLIYLTPCCFLIIVLHKLPIKPFWVQSVSCCQSLRHTDIQMKESKMAILLKLSLSRCTCEMWCQQSVPFDSWAMDPSHLLSDLFNCPMFPLNLWLIYFGFKCAQSHKQNVGISRFGKPQIHSNWFMSYVPKQHVYNVYRVKFTLHYIMLSFMSGGWREQWWHHNQVSTCWARGVETASQH